MYSSHWAISGVACALLAPKAGSRVGIVPSDPGPDHSGGPQRRSPCGCMQRGTPSRYQSRPRPPSVTPSSPHFWHSIDAPFHHHPQHTPILPPYIMASFPQGALHSPTRRLNGHFSPSFQASTRPAVEPTSDAPAASRRSSATGGLLFVSPSKLVTCNALTKLLEVRWSSRNLVRQRVPRRWNDTGPVAAESFRAYIYKRLLFFVPSVLGKLHPVRIFQEAIATPVPC